MDPEKPKPTINVANGNSNGNGADRPTPRDTYVVTTNDDALSVTRRRQSTPTSPGIVATTSLVPPPPVSTPPELPTYLIHPPTLPKQHVYAPMAPLGALSIGLMKHKASEEDQFSRLINGKVENFTAAAAAFWPSGPGLKGLFSKVRLAVNESSALRSYFASLSITSNSFCFKKRKNLKSPLEVKITWP